MSKSPGLALCALGALALTAPAFAAKAPAKKPVKPTQTVKGTQQMSGDAGEIGRTYTLSNNINFTLRSAEYSTDRVMVGDTAFQPKADEKLLVLHYSLKNPTKNGYDIDNQTVHFVAVDPQNVNHDGIQTAGDEVTHQSVNRELKPGQGVDVYTAVVVPAKGEAPKLILSPGPGHLEVLRYDLRGKAKKLAGPAADPADTTGASARDMVPAQMGQYYQLGDWDVNLEKAVFSDQPIKGNAPDEGKRYLLLTLGVKHPFPTDQDFYSESINPSLKNADGDEIPWEANFLNATSDADANLRIHPGAEKVIRIYYQVPKDASLKTLTLHSGEGRSFVYDVGGVQ